MATTYVGKSAPIRGPYLKHAFAKYVLKGEDAWLQQRDVETKISASKGRLSPSLTSAEPFCRSDNRVITHTAQGVSARLPEPPLPGCGVSLYPARRELLTLCQLHIVPVQSIGGMQC